jgi:hypothetical protein
MPTQHSNSNFYLFLAIVAILYHVNSTLTSVKDIHRILARQRLVEPNVESHQSQVQVLDMIARFDTFEKRFNARQIFNAHQRLVEPNVELHKYRVQASDMIARFDTFEERFNAFVEKVALQTPSEKRKAVENSNDGNETENLASSCSNIIDIESRKAEEEALKVIDEALKAEEEALEAMEKLKNVEQ